MKLTATPGKAEDSDAAAPHALTRDQRCGARQAWESADLQRWLQALQQEYGEQGSTVSQCDSTYTIIKSIVESIDITCERLYELGIPSVRTCPGAVRPTPVRRRHVDPART
jgi:hypothetical protein